MAEAPALASRRACDQCGQDLPVGLVRRGARRHGGECRRRWRTERSRRYYHEHREARLAYRRQHREARPAAELSGHRRWRLRTVYGLTEADYEHLVDEQAGLCAICRLPETRVVRGRPLPLSVDHDHATGRVRGLLCGRCNSVLGFIENGPLMAAATYYLARGQRQEVATS